MLQNTDSSYGWVQAIKDKNIGRALGKIHQTPNESWTVALLSIQAALSRTVFAERFTKLIGIPPMKYVHYFRMNLAGDMLREKDDYLLGEVAEKTGYSSEVSFSRAFKKFWGKPPGLFRRTPERGKPFGIGNC